MKRNFEAARQILLAVQSKACTEGIDRLHLEGVVTRELGVDPDDYFYNFKLLVNDGYLLPEHGTVQLTWSGHDLLDSLSLN
jgi:hypothetical protein